MSIIEQINKTYDHYWRSLFIRVGLVVLTTVLIVYFLPKNEGLQFNFQVGEPWHYSTVIAKYDFPIYKSEESLKNERDSLLRYFQPYYHYNSTIETKATNKLKNDFNTILPDLSEPMKTTLLDRVHRLYQAGIMSTAHERL